MTKRRGSLHDHNLGRATQVGLASISAAVRRAGGSLAHPGPALDDALELRAAYIEGGAGGEATSLGAWLACCALCLHGCLRQYSKPTTDSAGGGSTWMNLGSSNRMNNTSHCGGPSARTEACDNPVM